jgi:hypothetical protein
MCSLLRVPPLNVRARRPRGQSQSVASRVSEYQEHLSTAHATLAARVAASACSWNPRPPRREHAAYRLLAHALLAKGRAPARRTVAPAIRRERWQSLLMRRRSRAGSSICVVMGIYGVLVMERTPGRGVRRRERQAAHSTVHSTSAASLGSRPAWRSAAFSRAARNPNPNANQNHEIHLRRSEVRPVDPMCTLYTVITPWAIYLACNSTPRQGAGRRGEHVRRDIIKIILSTTYNVVAAVQ